MRKMITLLLLLAATVGAKPRPKDEGRGVLRLSSYAPPVGDTIDVRIGAREYSCYATNTAGCVRLVGPHLEFKAAAHTLTINGCYDRPHLSGRDPNLTGQKLLAALPNERTQAIWDAARNTPSLGYRIWPNGHDQGDLELPELSIWCSFEVQP